MIIRKSDAEWRGNLTAGSGSVKLASGAYEGPYSFQSRFENGTGTNPEELIAAAHAGCFSMAFSHTLAQAGFEPRSVFTTAAVKLEKVEGGFGITGIELTMHGIVPNIDEAKFHELAEAAKAGCPVSKALAAVPITLQATLRKD
jgi:osmotically inducible protein OsmC